MKKINGVLLQVCVICSLVCVTAKILDWYNPYMDFTGHIWGIQAVLYLAVLILGFIGKDNQKKKHAVKRRTETHYA